MIEGRRRKNSAIAFDAAGGTVNRGLSCDRLVRKGEGGLVHIVGEANAIGVGTGGRGYINHDIFLGYLFGSNFPMIGDGVNESSSAPPG